MRIMVLSDTHIPRVAADIPQKVYEDIPNVEMIIHAGDFVEKEVLDKLRKMRDVKAVYGNMDTPEVRNILNAKEVLQIGKVKIGLIHGYGAPRDLMETVKKEFSDVDCIIFGHSHSPVNVVRDGVLFFNPGSPTDKIFATENFYGILEIKEKTIEGKIIKI